MTLAELLVSMAVVAVLLPVGGALLAGAVSSQGRLDGVTQATSSAQRAAVSIEAGVRNASAVQPPTAPTVSSPNETLAVRTQAPAASGTTWVCQAWFYDAARSTVYTKRVPADSAGKAAIAAPPATDLSTWTVLAEGVRRRPIDRASTVPTTVATEQPLFSYDAARSRLTVDFRVPVSTRPQDGVVISTAAVARPQGLQTGSVACF